MVLALLSKPFDYQSIYIASFVSVVIKEREKQVSENRIL